MRSLIVKMLLAGAVGLTAPPGTTAQPESRPGGSSGDDEFKLVKVRGAVSLYERWVTAQPGQKVRELKAGFIVEAGTGSALALLQDASRTFRWMESLYDFKLLERKNTHCWTSYVRYKVPWPLDDQDVVLRCRLEETGNILRVSFQATDHTSYPVQPGITRMQGVSGAWTFEPISADRTKVVYTIITQNRSSFPRWMTDPIVQGNLLDTMNAFCVQAR